MSDLSLKITIIGAGRAGFQLGRALVLAGHQVPQIMSRQLHKAAAAAAELGSEPVSRLSGIRAGSDLYLLAVSDDAIGSVAAELAACLPEQAFAAHTSGATPAGVLSPHFARYGVFYPLQTLSLERLVDFRQVPLCVQAADAADQQWLFDLGRSISNTVQAVTDEQRAALHLAAVFVNNFTNAMLQAGYEIAERAELPFSLLLPLLEETFQKAQTGPPKAVQTGPALRRDEQTLQRHLRELEGQPELSAVYRAISRYIGGF